MTKHGQPGPIFPAANSSGARLPLGEQGPAKCKSQGVSMSMDRSAGITKPRVPSTTKRPLALSKLGVATKTAPFVR